MGNWIIRWAFNKPTYAPGDTASADFWLENIGSTDLYLSGLEVHFDFGSYSLQSIQGRVAPHTNSLLGRINLILPTNVVGQKIFNFNYRIFENSQNQWLDIGAYSSPSPYWIGIYPTPSYTAFVSRGLWPEDRIIGDPVTEMIREWGFETVTVGVEVYAENNDVDAKVRDNIRASDAVIAISTASFADALTGFWKTLEWCHAELGIGFGIDKPLLILNDRKVSLGGLPAYLALSGRAPQIEFDAYNLDPLKAELASVMPAFREWVGNKRSQDFRDSLKRLAVGGLAFIGGLAVLNGITGNASATSKNYH